VIDLRSWGKHWNEAAIERMAASLPSRTPSRPWPMVGMLAVGLVAGAAIGGYAVSQRAQIKRLAASAQRMGDGFAAISPGEPEAAATARSPRSNHRRKATSEV
jgi:hypothetical protein